MPKLYSSDAPREETDDQPKTSIRRAGHHFFTAEILMKPWSVVHGPYRSLIFSHHNGSQVRFSDEFFNGRSCDCMTELVPMVVEFKIETEMVVKPVPLKTGMQIYKGNPMPPGRLSCQCVERKRAGLVQRHAVSALIDRLSVAIHQDQQPHVMLTRGSCNH